MNLIHAQEKDKWKHMHAIVEGFSTRPLKNSNALLQKYLVDL